MASPDFTPEEKYLISYVRSATAKLPDPFMWGYLIFGCGFFVLSYLHELHVGMAATFALVVGARIYEWIYGNTWTDVLRSIFDKYETALLKEEAEDDRTSAG